MNGCFSLILSMTRKDINPEIIMTKIPLIIAKIVQDRPTMETSFEIL